jgi:hypothetical protein
MVCCIEPCGTSGSGLSLTREFLWVSGLGRMLLRPVTAEGIGKIVDEGAPKCGERGPCAVAAMDARRPGCSPGGWGRALSSRGMPRCGVVCLLLRLRKPQTTMTLSRRTTTTTTTRAMIRPRFALGLEETFVIVDYMSFTKTSVR